ncbi:unnamed protein product [Heterosigma akashiwo]|mmetsp:Transcript_1428/g.1809  ORF Transcript_1428/g.1809 Transcript_1428/m.1809 type:complete len:100 (+) Transcript_1428:96-395(+)
MANKNEQNANLEKVTDYVEEKEMDTENSQNMLQAISGIDENEDEESEQLFKGKLKKEDIDLIIEEFECTKEKAILALRKNGGEVTEALRYLLLPYWEQP